MNWRDWLKRTEQAKQDVYAEIYMCAHQDMRRAVAARVKRSVLLGVAGVSMVDDNDRIAMIASKAVKQASNDVARELRAARRN